MQNSFSGPPFDFKDEFLGAGQLIALDGMAKKPQLAFADACFNPVPISGLLSLKRVGQAQETPVDQRLPAASRYAATLRNFSTCKCTYGLARCSATFARRM